jgi:hypothetical protein
MENTENDYYTLPDGRLVFTEAYHKKRGFCCGNGCLHCPYDWDKVREPGRTKLLEKRNGKGPYNQTNKNPLI